MILHVVPVRIVGTARLLGRHVTAQEVAEIGGDALVVVGRVELQSHGQHRTAVVLLLSNVACLEHLVEHDVTALQRTLLKAYGVVERRVLTQTDKRSTLGERQVARLFREIDVGGSLDAHGVMEEVEIIEIQGDDFLLGVVTLQLHCDDPLDRLLQHALRSGVGHVGVELLGQLLRDGRATASVLLSQDATLDDGTCQRVEVDARVLVETHVLGGHQGLDERRSEVVVIDHHSVLAVHVPRSQELVV